MNGTGPESILVAEDEPGHVVAIGRALRAAWPRVAIATAGTVPDFREVLGTTRPEIALVDLNLPDGGALSVLPGQSGAGAFPIVVMTSQGGEREAVAAMKAGALDYVVKSAETILDMPHVVERALREWRQQQERLKAEESLRRREAELEAINEYAPVKMCVLNAARQVIYANRAFIEFADAPAIDRLTGPACGVVGCASAREFLPGGGAGRQCASCPARTAVGEALEKGHPCRGLEVATCVVRNGQTTSVVFLMSVTRLFMSGEPHVVLCLHDITERKQQEEELQASREQLRALAGSLQVAREEERKLVAREIHDVLAQDLTRLKIDLAWMHARLAGPERTAPVDALAGRVAEMTRLTDETIHAVQGIATLLRPAVLDGLGLFATVEWEANSFQARAGIPVELEIREDEHPIESDVTTGFFRILQESLTNVVRHAAATRVKIQLGQEAGELVMRVQDDGVGIPGNRLTHPRAIGLAGMRERALLLGGECNVASQPGSGTTIEVRIPRPVPSEPSEGAT